MIMLNLDFIEWEFYSNANTMRVFLHLLINARNGEVTMSYRTLATRLKMTVKQVRIAIGHLIADKSIIINRAQQTAQERAHKRAQQESNITICNYDNYVIKSEANGHSKGHTKGHTKGHDLASVRVANKELTTTYSSDCDISGGADWAVNDDKKSPSISNNIYNNNIYNNNTKKKENIIKEKRNSVPEFLDIRKPIADRKKIFWDLLLTYEERYSTKLIESFYLYWTETNNTNTKLRLDDQKYFAIGNRLATWANKEKTFSNFKN